MYTITIQHEKFGQIISETFQDKTQFKLFLDMLNGCLWSKDNFNFYNGEDFLVNIPNYILKKSIITTDVKSDNLIDEIVKKSRIESLV